MIGGRNFCAVGSRDGVAVDTAVARQHGSAKVELRCSGQRILMALAAACFNVTRGQYRLFPGSFAVMRFDDGGGRSLASMADDTTKSIDRVRNGGMLTEGLPIHIAKTRFIQPQVTGRAAIDDTEFRKPYLMQARLEATTQADSISAIVDQSEVMTLVATPLGEMVLGRGNGKRQQ